MQHARLPHTVYRSGDHDHRFPPLCPWQGFVSHPELEALILAAPHDLQRWSVLCDYMQTHGDPRADRLGLGISRARLVGRADGGVPPEMVETPSINTIGYSCVFDFLWQRTYRNCHRCAGLAVAVIGVMRLCEPCYRRWRGKPDRLAAGYRHSHRHEDAATDAEVDDYFAGME
jgi:hypothetical protein